ncbi:lipopolysaccharide transport periplasmic protein LptA [Paracoccus sp. p4-l81]|uniref:lipopolysaccharide transport periplasmic protein LptA n=1 Tax=unclassified Paracoccus (in: a-proteobacteria) TaxID=2688777 RepID=UPI0035B88BCB
MPMIPNAAATALILALMALPQALAAQQAVAFGGVRANTSAPVEVSADSLSVDQASGAATFSGNVVIGQGQMRLSATSVRVEYGDKGQSQIRRLHATGKVTLVSGPDAAEADEAVYEVDSGQVTLTGNVMLAQGQNVLSGNRMVVDLKTGSASVDGRVRSILQPGGN